MLTFNMIKICVFICFTISNFLLLTAAIENSRYLLYGCNLGEGFNLRRDVYIRISNLVKQLNEKEKWTLVLPPWGGMSYHWKEKNLEQSKILWSKFFDIPSLARHIDVIEYEDYIEEFGDAKIDEVWYLQDYEEGVDYDNWEDKIHERPCIDPPMYQSDSSGKFRGWFWGYEETYANSFKCVSVQGDTKVLQEPLLGANTTAQTVMIDRAEHVMHDLFGGKNFWDARRSMVFSKSLQDVALKYRMEFLDSNNDKDKTVMPENWQDNKRRTGDANGGPYIAAHLRRKDFVMNRKDTVPDLKRAANVLKDLAKKYNVSKIFVASDGTAKEIVELKSYLQGVLVYRPSKKESAQLKKGGVAIIDQIICSHAKYFIGTHESTFSFRIMEEREIMGFKPDVTYNNFCKTDKKCDQPTRWKVAWDDDSVIWQ